MIGCCCRSGSGQGSSGSGFSPCCVQERGAWPTNFPATLSLVISGSCCPDLNRSYTLVQIGGVGPAYHVSYSVVNGICRAVGFSGQLELSCGNDRGPGWTILESISLALSREMTLLSCDPLHLIVNNVVDAELGANACGGTSTTIEITE